MRSLICIMLAITSLSAMAKDLIVLVYTTDAKKIVYTCSTQEKAATIQRGVVMNTYYRSGGFSWHAVGGVPPYKVLNYANDQLGQVSVTVMDAEGNTGTGIGIIGCTVENVLVKCTTSDPQPTATVTYRTANAGAQARTPPVEHRRNPRVPEREYPTRGTVRDRVTPTTGGGTTTYSKPERPTTPSPTWTAPTRTVSK